MEPINQTLCPIYILYGSGFCLQSIEQKEIVIYVARNHRLQKTCLLAKLQENSSNERDVNVFKTDFNNNVLVAYIYIKLCKNPEKY